MLWLQNHPTANGRKVKCYKQKGQHRELVLDTPIRLAGVFDNGILGITGVLKQSLRGPQSGFETEPTEASDGL